MSGLGLWPLSSTLNASELKNSIAHSTTQLATSRCSRMFLSFLFLRFCLLMLSHVVDEAALLATLRRYIGLIIPGDSAVILEQITDSRM